MNNLKFYTITIMHENDKNLVHPAQQKHPRSKGIYRCFILSLFITRCDLLCKSK